MQSDQRGWESRVNEGLRLGDCIGSADSCENYHMVYYNLMLNIRFDTVCCLTKYIGIFYHQLTCMSHSGTTHKISDSGVK